MCTSADDGASAAALSRSLLELAEVPRPERITVSELVGALGERARQSSSCCLRCRT